MTDKPRRPGFAFWATVLLVVVVLYVASFGPAKMMGVYCSAPNAPDEADMEPELAPSYSTAYRPLLWISQSRVGRPLQWYWSLFPFRHA